MPGFSFDFLDALHVKGSLFPDSAHIFPGDFRQLSPGFTGQNLHFQPGPVLVLFCPDGAHFWAGVAFDQLRPSSSALLLKTVWRMVSFLSARRAAMRSSETLKIWAANRAAFTAPALPMAMVATGTPPGICTMERRESRPPRLSVCMGTPITGRVVLAAIIPARWAAPPAPAMITFRPRSRAEAA